MFTRHDIFTECIFERKVDAEYDKLLSDCFKLQTFDNGRLMSNEGGYQSNDLFNKQLQEFGCNDLVKLLTDLRTAVSELPFPMNNLHMANSWINLNVQGSSNVPHTHPRASLAGVYHITDTSPQTGELSIQREMGSTVGLLSTHDASDCGDPAYSVTHRKSYTAGTLILFPAYLMHSVSVNRTNTLRATLSFNVIRPD